MTSAPSPGAAGAANVDQSRAADWPGMFLKVRLRRVPPSDTILDLPPALPVTTRRTFIFILPYRFQDSSVVLPPRRLDLCRHIGQSLQHIVLMAGHDVDGDLLVAEGLHSLGSFNQLRARAS